jgi:hypothetical protein
MGYTGFLAGPPLIGALAELTRLGTALGLVSVLAGHGGRARALDPGAGPAPARARTTGPVAAQPRPRRRRARRSVRGVRAWPPISDPELLARLALDDAGFEAYVRELAARLGRRAYEPAHLEHALGYPWARPAGVLRPARRRRAAGRRGRPRLVAAFVRDRHPIVAFGANGAPSRLAAKLAHLPDAADRTVLVLTGDLHGVDVCAQAVPNIFGTLPARWSRARRPRCARRCCGSRRRRSPSSRGRRSATASGAWTARASSPITRT